MSGDPSVAFLLRRDVYGEDPASPYMRALRASIAQSPRVRALLAHRTAAGRIEGGVYRKWQGPHWTLHLLARLCYPAGDEALRPLFDQVQDWLLDEAHLRPPSSLLMPEQPERFRRCASQEGNAIRYGILLGLDDDRTRELARRLVAWRWPDGGWNCDKRPSARSSSLVETLAPLHALALAGKAWKDESLIDAARGAAELFLERGLIFNRRDGAPVRVAWGWPPDRIQHPIALYDVLTALEAMAELGLAGDPRCGRALDLLESKRLPSGGFPAEIRTATTSDTVASRGTWAEWGPYGKTRPNALVTARTQSVLRAAGRLGE